MEKGYLIRVTIPTFLILTRCIVSPLTQTQTLEAANQETNELRIANSLKWYRN